MNIDYATDKKWADNIAKIMNQFAEYAGCIEVQAHSPVELRVYDSQGRVTGVVNGEEKNEIPYSTCYENTVTIFSPYDLYSYEVVGTGVGSYGLTVTQVAEQITNFSLTNVPTSASAVHQYAIDWDALSQGKQSVTMKIDSDGDGVFEETRYLGNEREIPWLWIIIGAVAALVVALLIGRRTGKRQSSKASGKEET
jgi:hypothetical protein